MMGMTENKRFTRDNHTGYLYDNGEIVEDIMELLNTLADENEQLREALKNSYVTELCENCKYVIYESWEVPFCGWEHDRDCKKGHNEYEVTECDDFELNLKVWLND